MVVNFAGELREGGLSQVTPSFSNHHIRSPLGLQGHHKMVPRVLPIRAQTCQLLESLGAAHSWELMRINQLISACKARPCSTSC